MGNAPSKHAGSNPEVFWLWPVMAITASLQPELGWIVYAGSNFLDCFQFWFSEEGMGHTVQNWPGSDLDGLVRVWLNSLGLKASWYAGIIGPGFWQDATSLLLVSHFEIRLRSSTDVPDNIIYTKPAQIQFSSGWLCRTDPVWKKAIVQETSGPLLANTSQLIWPRCESDLACLRGLSED